MGTGHVAELDPRLREGHVKARLPEPAALEEILECERRLARAGIPLDEVNAVRGEAAAEDIIQPQDARGDQATRGPVPWWMAHCLPRPPRRGQKGRYRDGREFPGGRAVSPLGIVASHRGSRSRGTLHLKWESPSPQEETQSMLVYCRISCNFRAIIIINFPAEFGPAP